MQQVTTPSPAAAVPPLTVKGNMAAFNPSSRVPGVGPAGHFSATRLVSRAVDVPQGSQYDQSSLAAVGTFASPLIGLDGEFSYNNVIGSLVRLLVSRPGVSPGVPRTSTAAGID